jgi:hypothetical protein
MRRTLLGLFVASFAAPYLVMTFLGLFTFIGDGFTSSARFFDAVFIWGSFGALVFSVPTALLALVLALLLRISGLYSCQSVVVVGAALGTCFVGRIFLSTTEVVQASLSGTLSGAICGWIYWRIAIGSKRPLASPQDRSLSP